MKVYRTDEIRNVVLLGHGGCGKTSLVEAMAYVSGAVNRMGKVADGNTISDFDKEEQKRGFSISTSLVPIEWEKAKINILDTPGYFDFVGEVEEAVSAADAAVVVVSGKAGVEVGTEKAWELCDKYNLPRMVYVTEMDVDDASFREVVQQLTDRYGKKIAPHFQPVRENEKLVGYVNVIKNAGRKYTGIGQREECEIPEYCKPNLEIYREKLLEAVAEISEEYMERYFAGEEFSVEEIRAAMRTEVMEGSIVPVAMGSNIQAQGVANLLSDISSQALTAGSAQELTAQRMRSLRRIMISRWRRVLMYLRRWWIRLSENIPSLKFVPVLSKEKIRCIILRRRQKRNWARFILCPVISRRK